jgi:arsenate reductase
MQITIYHNPDCGTSRNALAAIRAAGYEPRIFEYLRTPLSRGALAALVARMDIPVAKVVRAREPLFRELGLDDKDIGEAELLDAMAEHPILIERPFVVTPKGTRLARPVDAVREIL